MKSLKQIEAELYGKAVGGIIVGLVGLFSLWQVSKLSPLAAWILCAWICLRDKK